MKIVRAIGGRYEGKSLAISADPTRWIVRDVGGTRTSVRADRNSGPADAIPGLKIEGYYRAGEHGIAALWTPIVAVADLVGGLSA